MNILIAIDSFKGSLSSMEAGRALCSGMSTIKDFNIQVCPVSDGGEGSLEALFQNGMGAYRKMLCKNAFGMDTMVDVLFFEEANKKCCAVETASMIGIHGRIPTKDTVKATSSYGLGQLILHLVAHEIDKILVFVGGTITTDAGLGALQALGLSLYDEIEELLPHNTNPLMDFDRYDKQKLQEIQDRLRTVELVIGTDVNAPLYGKYGCARMYARQKGADERQIQQMENRLRKLDTQCDVDLMEPGCGAGGGVAAGLKLMGGHLVSGFELIKQYADLETKVQWADLVVTGEGAINDQTLQGKLPMQMALLAKRMHKPIVALCGQKNYTDKTLNDFFDGIFSIQSGVCSLKEAIHHTQMNLEETGIQLAKLIQGVRL